MTNRLAVLMPFCGFQRWPQGSNLLQHLYKIDISTRIPFALASLAHIPKDIGEELIVSCFSTKLVHTLFAVTAFACLGMGEGKKVFAAGPQEKTVRVLAIHSYSQDYPWTAGQHAGFVGELERELSDQLEVKSEYLDTKRRKLDETYLQSFTSYLKIKYANYTPDAIYVTDDNGLNFAVNQLPAVFADIPVFFSGVNDLSQAARIDKALVTGVFERKEIIANLSLLQQLLGDVGNIIVIGDGSVTYQAIETELKTELANDDKLQVTYIASDKIDGIVDALARLPDQPVILTTLGAVQNAQGEVLLVGEVITHIASSHHEIIISMEDGYLLDGVLGGLVTSSSSQGKAAARLLTSYLAGRPLADIPPVTQSPNEYLFNASVLEAVGIELPAELAARSRLIHPPANWFVEHRRYITAAIILLTLSLALSLVSYLWALRGKNRQLEEQGEKLRKSEQSLQLESKFLNEVGRISGTGAWMIDLKSMALTLSAETRRIYEVPDDYEPTIADAIKVYPPDEQQAITAAIEESRTYGTPLDLELTLFTAKGNTKLVKAMGEAVFANGRPSVLIGAFQDITKQKEAEAIIQESYAEAERANRAKSVFLASMSHEIRTPLNAIIGFAEALEMGIGADDPVARNETLHIIASAGRQLNQLLADILDYTKIEAGKPDIEQVSTSPGDVFDDALPIIHNILNEKQLRYSEVRQSTNRIRVDPSRLTQILLNFISNAAKYNVDGGSVEFGFMDVETDRLRIYVTDTGIGIDGDFNDLIFSPFERGRSSRVDTPGAGLGLSICHKLTEAMGGTIGFTSSIGKGSTFWIEFPIVKANHG